MQSPSFRKKLNFSILGTYKLIFYILRLQFLSIPIIIIIIIIIIFILNCARELLIPISYD
jgi:hypothetical protein